MLRVVVLGLVLIHAIGCGKAQDSRPTTGPAGKVIEVVGKVSATRAGTARALAVDVEVFADDVVETASDASIVIVLAHNNARWSLEGGLRSRVDESVAWKLDRQEGTLAVEHATSAAGRHADRQAATTKESAVESAAAPAASDDPATVGAPAPEVARAAEREAPVAAPTPTLEIGGGAQPRPAKPAEAKKEVRRRSPARAPMTDASRAACDDVACMLTDNQAPCCAKFKKGARTAADKDTTPADSADSPGELTRDQIKQTIAGVLADVRACGTKHPAKGTVKLEIRVRADGTIAGAKILASPDVDLGKCVSAIVEHATYPRSTNGGTFTYPFVF